MHFPEINQRNSHLHFFMSAMMMSPVDRAPATKPPRECLHSCEGVCDQDPFTRVDDPVKDEYGCWVCPCLGKLSYVIFEYLCLNLICTLWVSSFILCLSELFTVLNKLSNIALLYQTRMNLFCFAFNIFLRILKVAKFRIFPIPVHRISYNYSFQ